MLHNSKIVGMAAALMVLAMVLFIGCSNVNPINPPASPPNTSNPSPAPAGDVATGDVTVVYNYGDTGDVQLSGNNLTMKVGQKLILQPAPGLTKSTRFSSSGENFFGDIMKQETSPPNSGNATFTAIKAGKGKLQIIPNNTETDRAVDLWVTVQ